ncbi:MAG: translesion error-prone DNA polymerase V autoproteolytic subunit [Muribaculum sp.]|nr:translesion error-prone DNA polymerase V autoproteolytic subunit [Muribaculaceae bacterium]MCM1080943.1 translesion error-prone DNA polymerase V autoproteolytic subunit [Muribaculum sp.]
MELKDRITIYTVDMTSHLSRPLSGTAVRAGFPSPGQDYVDESIDLNRYLVKHPASTFYAKVEGLSMAGEGIDEGDILVIDRSLAPENGDLAVCCVDGEFTLKRIRIVDHNKILLLPSNPEFSPIEISADDDFSIWGIVTSTIKLNRRRSRLNK